jgi:hypothetical protein
MADDLFRVNFHEIRRNPKLIYEPGRKGVRILRGIPHPEPRYDADRTDVRGGPLFCDAANHPRHRSTNHVPFQARDKMIDFSGNGLPPQRYDIGGVSGGPMLMPTLTDQGIIWRFAGVIVEAAAGDLFEQVVAVRATFIQPNGRIG